MTEVVSFLTVRAPFDGTVVPCAVERGDRQMVAVVEADEVVFRNVSVGRDFGERVEVVSGLDPSDRVILAPNALLREGDTVVLLWTPSQGRPARRRAEPSPLRGRVEADRQISSG